MYLKQVLLLAIFVGGLLIFQPSSIADNHQTPEEEFDDGSHDREVTVDLATDEIRLEAELKEGLNKDRFRVEIKLDSSFPDDNSSGEIEIRFSYNQGINTTQISFQYRLEMTDIIEYVENGTLPGYQEGEEVSIYNIGGTGWNDIGYTTDTTTVGNDTDTTHIFNIRSLDGVFGVVVRVADSVVDLGNATLTPNAVKMDVHINNFPYTVANSSLALKSKVKTGAEMSVEEESTDEKLGLVGDETEIKLSVNGTEGFFSWANSAIADGNIIDVIDSPLTNVTEADSDVLPFEDNVKMFFSFDAKGATDILWDPKVGVISKDINFPTPDATVTETVTISEPGATVTETASTVTEPAVTVTETDTDSAPGMTFFLSLASLAFAGLYFRARTYRNKDS